MSNDINGIIDISEDFDDLSKPPSHSSFGSGIELLMNEKKKPVSEVGNKIGIDDLEHLENELNGLSDSVQNDEPHSGYSPSFENSNSRSSLRFDDTPSISGEPIRLNMDAPTGLGQATSETATDAKTWDGYGKFNNVPVNPDMRVSGEPRMSKDELVKEKFKYLRKLEALEKKGVELTKKYSMESNLTEMQGEYEMIMEEKERHNSVKFQGNMLMAIINGIEFFNNKLDRLRIK